VNKNTSQVVWLRVYTRHSECRHFYRDGISTLRSET